MSDEYKKKIGIHESRTMSSVSSQLLKRKSQDTDTYEYEKLNEKGEFITRYTIKNSTSIYLAFGLSIT